jgi:hypothetical protein
MKRIFSLLLALLLMNVAAPAQEKPTGPPSTPKPAEATAPTIDQILDKYVAALGGKAALEKNTSRTIKGTMEIAAANLSGPFEVQSKAPNLWSLNLDLPGVGIIKRGYDGTVGYELTSFNGLREITGNELTTLKNEATFNRELKLKELYPKMEVKGKEKVGSREAWVVLATPASGKPDKFYFDAETGLLIRVDGERESSQGKLDVESHLDDYRAVDGVRMPHAIRQVSQMGEVIMKITEVKTNGPVDESRFKKPAAQ